MIAQLILVLKMSSWLLVPPPSNVAPITLAHILRPMDDTTVVVVRNFWATWCKPCVEELPLFGMVARRDRSLRIELISLDAPRDSAKVRAFWKRRGFEGVRVFHMQQQLRTHDIDAIAPEWSGAIPVTIVQRGSRRFVYEGQLDSTTLCQLIERARQ
ncbi:MAG: TlpA family protein disulfide reductase [Chlorobi bacterium]|nr:TlpA family protein disulfide reductase [Chlorobiota bacterium]